MKTKKLIALVILTILLTAKLQFVEGAEIWIGTSEPQWRQAHHWKLNDYMAMFTPNASWSDAARDIKVFHLTKRFVVDAPDDQIRTVLNDLKRRHIQVAVQATPLNATAACGRGAEGHGPPSDMEVMAAKLHRLGAELDYLAMDEPLWFGHRWNGTAKVTACHYSISEIAKEAATKMRAVRRYYPNVKIGDIEPMGIPRSQDQGWPEEIGNWIDAYQKEMGEPLAFVQADVVWLNPNWKDILIGFAKEVQARKIPLGIIYNGTPLDKTDAAWVDSAEAHYKNVEVALKIKPAQAFFFSWMEHPQELMPESKHGTLTNLILSYANWQLQKH